MKRNREQQQRDEGENLEGDNRGVKLFRTIRGAIEIARWIKVEYYKSGSFYILFTVHVYINTRMDLKETACGDRLRSNLAEKKRPDERGGPAHMLQYSYARHNERASRDSFAHFPFSHSLPLFVFFFSFSRWGWWERAKECEKSHPTVHPLEPYRQLLSVYIRIRIVTVWRRRKEVCYDEPLERAGVSTDPCGDCFQQVCQPIVSIFRFSC